MAITGGLGETLRWLILAPDWYAVMVALIILGLGLGMTYHFKRDLDEWTFHDWGFFLVAAVYTYVKNARRYEEVKIQRRSGDENESWLTGRYLPEEDDKSGGRSTSAEAVKAPSISALKIIHGDPVQLGKGKITIVFFWSPTDKASRAVLAPVSALARRYRDRGLQVLGVSNADETLVQGYLKGLKRRIDFSVAIDLRQPQTENDHHIEFLQDVYASRQGVPDTCFPCAYIVGKKGCIQWYGHPAHCEREFYELIDRTA